MSCQRYAYKLLYSRIVMLFEITIVFSFNFFLPFSHQIILLFSLYKELRCPYDDKYPNIVHVENGNLDNGEKLDNAVVTQTDDFEG